MKNDSSSVVLATLVAGLGRRAGGLARTVRKARSRTLNKDQENARRVRQIEAGTLGPENRGVVLLAGERDKS